MIAYAATLVALAVVLWPAARPVGAARDRGAGRPLPRALRAAREDGSLGPAHAVGAMDPVGSTHGAAATRRSDSGAASRRRAPAGPRVRPDEVAVVMDLIAVCCRSGGALVDALSAVGTVSEARVRRDLSCVVAALAWGVDADQAWALVGSAWRPGPACRPPMPWGVVPGTCAPSTLGRWTSPPPASGSPSCSPWGSPSCRHSCCSPWCRWWSRSPVS